jgi:hypothetical protein
MIRYFIAAVAAASFTMVSGPSAAVAVGQVDTFEDSTAMGWFFGGGPNGIPVTPATNVASGGPTGSGDSFLSVSALGGAGPRSRLSVMNSSQWSGNYLGAGVGQIQMDVNNAGTQDLFLRLLFEQFTGVGPPTNVAVTADVVIVPAGSGWLTIDFSITPSDLVALLGTPSAALTDTDVFRIIHNPAPTFFGGPPPVVAALGIDNIMAVGRTPNAVPEPRPLSLVAVALLALVIVARRKASGGGLT